MASLQLPLSSLPELRVAPVNLLIEVPERAACEHCGGVACVTLRVIGALIIWNDHAHRHDISCKILAATKA